MGGRADVMTFSTLRSLFTPIFLSFVSEEQGNAVFKWMREG